MASPPFSEHLFGWDARPGIVERLLDHFRTNSGSSGSAADCSPSSFSCGHELEPHSVEEQVLAAIRADAVRLAGMA